MQRLLIGLLRVYKEWISPLLPSACRFHPTCSAYAREAIEKHGAARGSWLAVKRLGRCHPFCTGGLDPVPEPSMGTPRKDANRRSLLKKNSRTTEPAPRSAGRGSASPSSRASRPYAL